MSNEFKPLTEAEVTFTVECEPEHCSVRGNAMASGDEQADREEEDLILAELHSGNEWAWCTVKVTASWRSFSASDYLGCCSYASKEDFMTPDGYYPDMRAEALASLNDQIRAVWEELHDR